MRNFREYDIYKSGMEVARLIYTTTNDIDPSEKYSLIKQMRRAAVSIPSNIAEGSSRSSSKDFARLLEIALGSAFELETQLQLAADLKFLSEDQVDPLMISIVQLQKQIHHLIKILRKE